MSKLNHDLHDKCEKDKAKKLRDSRTFGHYSLGEFRKGKNEGEKAFLPKHAKLSKENRGRKWLAEN